MQEKSDRTFWRFWGESFTLFVFQDVDGKLSAKCWNALRLGRRGRGSLTHSIEGSCASLVRTKYIADVLGVEMKGSGVPLAPSQQLEDGRFLSGGLFPAPVFLNWADVCKKRFDSVCASRSLFGNHKYTTWHETWSIENSASHTFWVESSREDKDILSTDTNTHSQSPTIPRRRHLLLLAWRMTQPDGVWVLKNKKRQREPVSMKRLGAATAERNKDCDLMLLWPMDDGD